jgi:hypothetical protein
VTIHQNTLCLAVPVSKNVWQRQHWRRRYATKRRWEDQIWAQVNERPRCPRPAVAVTADVMVYWDKPGVLPDHHNLDMVHEVVADGLVKAGILEDDAGGVYERGAFAIERVKKGKGRTVVTLHVDVN